MGRAAVPRTESPPPGAVRHVARVLILVGLIVGGVAAGDWVYRLARLRAWRAALTEVRPEQAPAHLRAALWLGAPGKVALIEVLDARPAALGLAARDVLRDHLRQLRRANPNHPEMTSLAHQLAVASGQFTIAGKQRAADLAFGLLEQSPGPGENAQWVDECEAVLDLCGYRGRSPDSAGRARVVAAIDRSLQRPNSPPALLHVDRAQAHDVFPALAQLDPRRSAVSSGPAAPAASSQAQSLTGGAANRGPSDEPAPSTVAGDSRPRRPAAASGTLAGAPLLVNPQGATPPDELPRTLREAAPVRAPVDSGDAGSDSPGLETGVLPLGHAETPAGTRDPAAPGLLPEPGTRATLIDLFRGLHDGDPVRVESTRGALAERGFSTEEIAVGHALTHPNPAQRRRMVEELPQRPVDAKPWLVAASRDPAPAVRRAAVAIMATSQDTELLARVAEMARADADAEVRRLAERAGRIR